MIRRMKLGKVQIAFFPDFFRDVFYRRVGWKDSLRPYIISYSSYIDLSLWCFFVSVTK